MNVYVFVDASGGNGSTAFTSGGVATSAHLVNVCVMRGALVSVVPSSLF